MSVQCHLRPLGSLSYFLYSILLVLPCSMNLEKAMAPHSSTLAWKIPWMEEPGGLQSMGLLRVGHDWATSLSLSCIGGGNGNPLQCSCLENPRDGRAWWAAIYGVAQSRTRLKRLSSSSMNIVQSDQFPWKSAPISIPTSKPFLPTYVSKLSSALSFPMDISQSLCFLPLYPNIGFATKGPNNRTSSLLP